MKTKLKSIVKQVRDLPQDDTYIIIDGYEEIQHVFENIGLRKKWRKEFGCLIVQIGEGDYNEIWACTTNVPWNDSYSELIYKNGQLLLK